MRAIFIHFVEKNEICVELNWIREQRKFISQSLIEEYKKIQAEKSIEKRKMYKEKLEKSFSGKEVIKFLEIFAENTEKEQLAKGLKNREKELEEFMIKNQKAQ